MNIRRPYILTVNAGSSSIKFALFSAKGSELHRIFDGAVLSIDWPSARMTVTEDATSKKTSKAIHAPDHVAATQYVVEWLQKHVPSEELLAIGHRIVHGGPRYHEPQIVTDEVLSALRDILPFDPLHLSNEIKLLELFATVFPRTRQVACFDTAFHHDMPRVAQLLPLPRKYDAAGLRRYGFHGLSCASIMSQLQRVGKAGGRIVIAHLGNGVSLTAVKDGKSVDTTMALTPAAGVPMSTRSGDIDPGIVLYLAKSEGQSASEFDAMINEQSGLLGVSETTSDMEELLNREDDDIRAKEAADLFCYSVKKSVGALAAAMGGLDTLVFTGGMGENAPKIRERVCEGLGFLGIHISRANNGCGDPVISSDVSTVEVRLMHTEEATTIAYETWNRTKGEKQ